MNQLDLFAAAQARDNAINQVEQHAPPSWLEAALSAVRLTAEQHDEFTTDLCKEHCSLPDPPEPRAWGAVMRIAAKEKICEPTDRTQNSRSRVCHARPMRVWRSLIRS